MLFLIISFHFIWPIFYILIFSQIFVKYIEFWLENMLQN